MSNITKLNVKCSPRTFQRVSADKEYRDTVAQEVAGTETFDEIVFFPNAEESPMDMDSLNTIDAINVDEQLSPMTEVEGKKTPWLDSSTKMLIAKVKELRPIVGKSASLKNKKQMWNKIARVLCENGHNFNGTQVEAKFFSLERQYKKTQLHNSKTGRSRQTCPYQSELDDLLQKKRSLNPDYVLDSETEVTSDDLSSNDCLNSSQSEKLDVMPSTSKRRKTTFQEFIEKSDEHTRKREENDEKLQKLLEESIKKREERAERKEKLENKQIELLESLVNILGKK